METQKNTLTLHRALAEIKMLEKRILRKTSNLVVIGHSKVDSKVGNKTVEEFNTDVLADFSSIEDLIARKNLIKSLIVQKNSETMIIIGEEKLSISDAITKKEAIGLQENVLHRLKAQLTSENAFIERHNATVEKNAINLAEAAVGKEGVNIDDSSVTAITEPYIKANELSLVDPLDLEKKIKTLEDSIDIFKSEVDAVLSEANAITLITLD